MLTNSQGSAGAEYSYEPFGKTTQTGAANTKSFKFTGRKDDGSGLYYYRARYYQPRFQRFIAEDPIGFAGGDVNLGSDSPQSRTALVEMAVSSSQAPRGTGGFSRIALEAELLNSLSNTQSQDCGLGKRK